MNYNVNVEEQETNKRSVIVDVLLKVLLIGVILFILICIFPTKKQSDPLLEEIFRNNITTMREAAEKYFTNDRLPKKVGESVRLTLKEMEDMKLIVPFKDKYNKDCDKNASYVEITKTETEYELKVNLVCSKDEAYIVDHLGCTDKCLVLGNKEETKKPNNSSNSGNTGKKVTLYEYRKQTTSNKLTGYKCDTGYTLDNKSCVKTTTDKKNATPVYENKTTTVNANKTTKTVDKILYKYGKEVTTTTTVEDKSKPIRQYTYDNVIGTSTRKVCTGYKYFVNGGTLYQAGEYKYSKTLYDVTDVPKDTATTKYEVVGMNFDKCWDNCSLKPYFIVKVYTRTATTISSAAESNLSATCTVKEQEVPIYGLKIQTVGYVQNKVTKTEKVYAWSESTNDQKLLSQNYGYLKIAKKDGTKTVTEYSCPTGTTKVASDQTKCTKTEKVVKNYTCPAGYTLKATSCEKTTTDKKNATPEYKKVTGYEYTWNEAKSLKGWTSTGRTKTVTK